MFSIARALEEAGNTVASIMAARSKELFFCENKLRAVKGELILCTDDASYGRKGVAPLPSREMLAGGRRLDWCGPSARR